VLIRHAPIAREGILCGHTDAPARVEPGHVARVAAALDGVAEWACSPALRCQQTAKALLGCTPLSDARLWEQNFGAYDGKPYSALPDLGVLDNRALAAHRWDNGESFDDLCARVFPALKDHAKRAQALAAPVALVVHAGVVRAGIGLALGVQEAGLSFEIAPLSVTSLRVGPDGPISVMSANERYE
jgi:alpha-ribazole phosphatase